MTNESNGKTKILIIDDEPAIRSILVELLSEKYSCTTAMSAEEALQILEAESFNLVLSDIEMGGMSGIEIIPKLLSSAPDTVVIMISGLQSIESAIEAMRVGAFDYIKKPFEIEHVEVAVERALSHHDLLRSKRLYEYQLEELVKKRTEQVNHLIYHDALTDLPNRNLFEDRLTQALIQAKLNQHSLAVILISINQIAKIYSTLGHTIGYRLLQQVAERLKACVREGVTIARFEGDEFASLLSQTTDTENVIRSINDINEALRFPFKVDDYEIFITSGIGISIYPDDSEDGHTLLKNAAVALSRAKEQGENTYNFYTGEMDAKALRRLGLEQSLRRALEREEFEIHYQPKIDINTRRIVGMEALVRWHHAELGLISPVEFIPIAESTGLILQIGEWILRNVCQQCKLWSDVGLGMLQVSVNLSVRQLQQENLAEIIFKIIRETGFDSYFLELEVTESSIMMNAEAALKTLYELKESGIKISIDDFGTGYSSLGYLKRLPIDILKIDKSFIQDVTVNPDDAALVMTIINLAHSLRLKVIAEGVETEEQLRFLHLLRCDEWQGYLYSKPVASKEFELLLKKDRLQNNLSKDLNLKSKEKNQ